MKAHITLSDASGLRGSSLVLLCLLAISISFLSPNPVLFLSGAAVLILFVYLFFNKNLPPVLLFSFFFQWLFLQGQLLDGLMQGESLVSLDYFSPTKIDVTIIGLVGTSFFFFGIYIVARKLPVLSTVEFNSFFKEIRLERLLMIYVGIYFILFTVGVFIWYFPGLSQPLNTLTYFRWSIFFILFSAVFVQNRLKGVLLLLILGDIAISFVSFFSHFKEVIYFSFISYWIFFFRNSTFSRIVTIGILLFTVYLGAVWTFIKKDYRAYLNRGEGVQAVLRTRDEAYSKLFQLAMDVDGKDVKKGFEELIDRLSIIIIFDAVYKRVPKIIPHENGSLWLKGISRPFMPRLLFPDKAVLSDSKELNYYSDLEIDEEHTSVSLTMMAGSYVDFGKWIMHLPLFVFGLFCGWAYMKAIEWGKHPIIGYALSMPMIYLLHINEESIARTIPAMVLYILVLWFVKKFLLYQFLYFIGVKSNDISFT